MQMINHRGKREEKGNARCAGEVKTPQEAYNFKCEGGVSVIVSEVAVLYGENPNKYKVHKNGRI